MSKVKLMELLHDLSALIRRRPKEKDEKLPSHRACRVLTVINLQGSMNQRTLAAKLGIRPQSLSEVIDKLEKDAFIKKIEDKTNKKANMIVLTQKGINETVNADKRIEKHANTFFDALSDEEIETFIKLIEKIIHSKNIENEHIGEEKQYEK